MHNGQRRGCGNRGVTANKERTARSGYTRARGQEPTASIRSLHRARCVLLGKLHSVLRLARLQVCLLSHHRLGLSLRLRLLLLVDLMIAGRGIRCGLRRRDMSHARLCLKVRCLSLGLSMRVCLLLLLLLRDLLLLVRMGVRVVVCGWRH